MAMGIRNYFSLRRKEIAVQSPTRWHHFQLVGLLKWFFISSFLWMVNISLIWIWERGNPMPHIHAQRCSYAGFAFHEINCFFSNCLYILTCKLLFKRVKRVYSIFPNIWPSFRILIFNFIIIQVRSVEVVTIFLRTRSRLNHLEAPF